MIVVYTSITTVTSYGYNLQKSVDVKNSRELSSVILATFTRIE